jgi:replication factor C subunit 3/5
MYGSNAAYRSMTLELNASDARGIDVVRNEIKDFASTQQLFQQGIKLIILDEADAMTNDAQFALRRMIEKYTKNVRFCLICNYVSRIIPALQSRCTRFRFSPLQLDLIRHRLEYVAQQEQVKITEDGIDGILRLSGGDMRRVLNLLQSTAMAYPMVDQTAVYLTSGAPLPSDVDHVLDLLMNADFATASEGIITMCTTKGYALTDLITEIAARVVALDMDAIPLGQMLDGLSNVEYRLASGTDETIQAASLVGVFVLARESTQMLIST